MGQPPEKIARMYDTVAIEYAERFSGEHEKTAGLRNSPKILRNGFRQEDMLDLDFKKRILFLHV